MQKLDRTSYILYAALLLLALGILELIFHEQYGACHAENEKTKKYCGSYYLYGFFSMRVLNFLEAYNAAIAAGSAFLVMIITGVLAYIASKQREVTRNQVSHFERSERAYVQMSHTPPGVSFHDETGNISIRIKITNKGQTPANILDVHAVGIVLPRGKKLPPEPAYRRDEGYKTTSTAFLVTGGHFFHYRARKVASPDEATRIRKGLLVLRIIGYVDYQDVFGNVHRAGYGRTYDPLVDIKHSSQTTKKFSQRNNLFFIDQPGYNFDRPRRAGEEWV